MPVLSATMPTTVTLGQGDQLFYSGTCSLRVSLIKANGNTAALTTLSENSFWEAPVAASYRLTTSDHGCCKVGDYEIFPKIDPPDYENIVVCDTVTETLWEKWYKIEADTMTILMDWTDTGRPCVEPKVITQEYCVEP